MGMMIYGEDEVIAKWVDDKIDYVNTGFGPHVAFGYATDSGRLIAGFVYNEWRPAFKTIQISMAAISPMWAKNEVIHEVLSYPFEQLEAFKVLAVCRADNKKILEVTAHIGFVQEAILAHQFGKKHHAVVMRMLQPDYSRLFGERYGQGRSEPAGASSGERAWSSGYPSQI